VLSDGSFVKVPVVMPELPSHTWKFSGTTLERVVTSTNSKGDTVEQRETLTYSTQGAKMTFTRTCAHPTSAPPAVAVEYTVVSATELVVYLPQDGGGVLVLTLKKKP